MANEELDFTELGSTGLRRSDGQIFEEHLPHLQGIRGIRLYREMSDNNAIVGALLHVIETFVVQVKWRFEPSDATPESAAQARFMDGIVEDMSHTWEDLLSEILSMLIFGWSYFEIVHKLRNGDSPDSTRRSAFDDGKIGWRKIAIRSAESLEDWEFDDDGGLRGMHQRAAPDFDPVFLPIEKSLLFRTKMMHGNPEGRSMLRNAVRSYQFLKRIQEHEAVGIERDMAGLPIFEVPAEYLSKTASAAQKQVLSVIKNIVQQVRRDEREGAVIPAELDSEGKPTGFKFKLLSTGGRRQFVTNDVINRYEKRIAATALADFILLGMDRIGTQSLASSKTNTFAVSLGALMARIASVFNRFAIPRLMKLNHVPRDNWPQLVHGDIETPPLDEVSNYVTRLAAAGMLTPDKVTERKLREIGNLPNPENNDGV